MPHSDISARARPGSDSPVNQSLTTVAPCPQFTESQHSPPDSRPSRPRNKPDSVDRLSLDITEPFPEDLFRVPVPDRIFSEMPEMTDSALRALLGMIRLSFRFEPEKGSWVTPERSFTRSEIESESGLSCQGTRNGLKELSEAGYVSSNKAGRTYEHKLEIEVPTSRYTYVPTALLEVASGLGGTELRLVLAVIRTTWGWTSETENVKEGPPAHRRWARLSTSELAQRTGRSRTAVKEAAAALQGQLLERLRPNGGTYHYRFLPEAITPQIGAEDASAPPPESGAVRVRTKKQAAVSVEIANDLTPDRQNSDPPSFNRESFREDKHRSQEENARAPSGEEPSSNEADAVPGENFSGQATAPEATGEASSSGGKAPPPDFSDLPPEKQDLAEKLSNVGIWAGRIAEVLSRFSTERIRANVQLYRRRAAEQTIRKPGAWLYKAITDGYALPGSSTGKPEDKPESSETTAPGALPPLQHEETVSEAKKDAYVAQGTDEERFHRCPSGRSGPEERRFMYFDPAVGGPERRV